MHCRRNIPFRSTRAVAAVLCLLLLCGGFAQSAFADKPAKSKKENRRAESHQIELLEQNWLHALTKGDTAVLE